MGYRRMTGNALNWTDGGSPLRTGLARREAVPRSTDAGSSHVVERLTYALASSDSPDEAASHAIELIHEALGSDVVVRIAIPAASGRLRVAWRSGTDAADGPRLRSARRLAFERRMYRSADLAADVDTLAVFFPLAWRDRSIGVLEIQASVEALHESRATIGAIACQLAGVLAGLTERRRLEQQVRAFEATAGTRREILQARRPQDALDLAANALWRASRRPVALWWADPDGPRSLVAIVGVGTSVKHRLADRLRRVRPVGEVITPSERRRVIGHVAEALGRSSRVTVRAADRCLVIVAATGPLVQRRTEMIAALLGDSLPLVSASARHEQDASSLDLGLAWTAHELRTPILGVKAALESVADRSDARAGELLRLSVDELDKLASDTEGILGWATGRRDLERRPVDVSSLVADAVAAHGQLHGHAARITVEAPRPAVAAVDPTHLRAAVTNLVRNALAYAGSEGVTVIVDEDDGIVRVSVRDGGPGVPDAERAQIFEPFARGAVGARHVAGSGLGLFIARRVAEAHGGRAWVDPEAPGRGATFHIEVPADGRILQRPAS